MFPRETVDVSERNEALDFINERARSVMATTTKPSAELALDDAASTRFVRFFADVVASDGGQGGGGGGGADETTTRNGRRVVRFFDRKDFMSAHGDDATYIARTFYKVRATRFEVFGVVVVSRDEGGGGRWFRRSERGRRFGTRLFEFSHLSRAARRWMKGCGDEGRRVKTTTDERMHLVVI